ncbi:hypothetical protein ACHQM5_008675 [Ranunculus cassubicifolius]
MKLISSFPNLLLFISIIFLPLLISSQPCKKSCGDQPIRYPFGSGPGCGDPRIEKYITCNDQQTLTFTTHTGTYTISSIDYNNQILYIRDPLMSTCSETQPSRGFSLDWDAPFTFHDDNVFALLGCSIDSSPLYKSQTSGNGTTMVPLCDNQGAPICSLLYSCSAINKLNFPISTCCVYTPVDLGPSFEMDLQKLKCSAYAAVYSFGGQESNPDRWDYGVGLKYKFRVNNDYPSDCGLCERSNGVCGYTGPYNSFICNCAGGLNTTTDCYFRSSWSKAVRLVPQRIGMLVNRIIKI